MPKGFMTEKEAAVALVSYFTGRGPVNGGFATKLISLFESADVMNRRRLLSVYPEFEGPTNTLSLLGIDGLEKKIDEGYFEQM